VPEFRGRQHLREFFTARSSKQKGYRLRKAFRSLDGDITGNVWEGEREDAVTGGKMKGYGVEIWKMRGGKIAVWEAAFNVAAADAAGGVADMLS
jgi:nuclear transport factor 2 (NTF2) superfamily protein